MLEKVSFQIYMIQHVHLNIKAINTFWLRYLTYCKFMIYYDGK